MTIREHVALAQAAESAGFDQYWVANDLMIRSAPVILAAVAQGTSRIEIGSCIMNPFTVNPAEIAMFAASMDELSGCRFNLGFAAGAGEFLNWIGIDQPSPLAAVRESVAAIRLLLEGKTARMDGRFLKWSDAAYLRFPAPRVTPIYIGASGPLMLKLAGEIGDGVLPLLFPPEHYANVRPLIDQGLAIRQEGRGGCDIVGSIWASLGGDRDAAKRLLAEKIAIYGSALAPIVLEQLGLTRADFEGIDAALVGNNDMDSAVSLVSNQMLKIGIVGSAEDIIERLEPIVAAGLRHISFGPPLGPDRLEAIELIGRHIIPHFRKKQGDPGSKRAET